MFVVVVCCELHLTSCRGVHVSWLAAKLRAQSRPQIQLAVSCEVEAQTEKVRLAVVGRHARAWATSRRRAPATSSTFGALPSSPRKRASKARSRAPTSSCSSGARPRSCAHTRETLRDEEDMRSALQPLARSPHMQHVAEMAYLRTLPNLLKHGTSSAVMACQRLPARASHAIPARAL
eukprot:1900700-Prymnesium_polylepis.2